MSSTTSNNNNNTSSNNNNVSNNNNSKNNNKSSSSNSNTSISASAPRPALPANTTTTTTVPTADTATRRGGHPSRQKRFGPAPLASFEDLPTDDQDSSPENNEPRARATACAHTARETQEGSVALVGGSKQLSTGHLRLELDARPGQHHRTSSRSDLLSDSRGGSELSTPVAPDSDAISQATITPTADSRNASPLLPGATRLTGELLVAGRATTTTASAYGCYSGGNNLTAIVVTKSPSIPTSLLTEQSSCRNKDEVDGSATLPKHSARVVNENNDELAKVGDRVGVVGVPDGCGERPLVVGRISVTQATIEIVSRGGEDDNNACEAYLAGVARQRTGLPAAAPAADEMAADTAITSEAILESLLKFEEERIPLAARLERSCQSIADIPSASHSRKNSSSVQQQEQPASLEIKKPKETSSTGADNIPLVPHEKRPDVSSTPSNPEAPAEEPSRTNNGLSESDSDHAPGVAGSADADEDALADLSSSAAGTAATRRRRRRLRPQTSDDRFESLRLLPAQDSVDVEEDDDGDYELQQLGRGPEVIVGPADPEQSDEPQRLETGDAATVSPHRTQQQQQQPQPTTTPHSHPPRPQLVTIPIERPRSTTPINVAPLEAYIQQQVESTGGQQRAGSHSSSSSGAKAGGSRSPDRLKLTLPGQNLGGNLARSPRKGSLRNWEEFCEEALQHSPRARSKSDAAALGQRFFPDPLDFSPASPPRPPEAEDEIQSPSDYQDPFRRRLTCSCKCRTCACLCGGCDCDCHFYTQKVCESHLNDPMSRIVEINGVPGSPREDEQSLLSPEESATQGPCLCECHTLPRDTSCLLTAPLLVAQSSLDSC